MARGHSSCAVLPSCRHGLCSRQRLVDLIKSGVKHAATSKVLVPDAWLGRQAWNSGYMTADGRRRETG